MALIARDSGGIGYDPIPEGLHMAYCSAVVDIGEHENKTYGKTERKVIITWTLPEETIVINDLAEPRVISKPYTLSLNERSTLRSHLKTWRGRDFTEQELEGFDLKNILGVPCQIQIIHETKDGKTYANIATIVNAPKGYKQQVFPIEPVFFDLDESPLTDMERLPEWVRKRIAESITYQQIISQDPDYEAEEHYPQNKLSEEQQSTIFTAMSEWDNVSEIEAALLNQFQIGDINEITADQFNEALAVIGRMGKQVDNDVPF